MLAFSSSQQLAVGVQVALMDATSGRARSVAMVLQTGTRRGGGCNITLHSGVQVCSCSHAACSQRSSAPVHESMLLLQIKNDTMLMMSIGTAAKDGIQTSRVVQAGQTMWLPLAHMPSTDVTVLPTGKHQLPPPVFHQETAAVPLAFCKQ